MFSFLNKTIKLRWAIRTFLVGFIIAAVFYGGRAANNTMTELNERDSVVDYMKDHLKLTRGYLNNAYGSYWFNCGLWTSAAHVHKETLGDTPPPVARNPFVGFTVDAVFYGERWECKEPPAGMYEGQAVWLGGYPGASIDVALRRGTVYLKRSVSGSHGYETPTWIVVFEDGGIADWLSEPVIGGMSGGVVIDRESLEPVGIIATQNSPVVLPKFGPDEVNSSDVVALSDAYNILLKE